MTPTLNALTLTMLPWAIPFLASVHFPRLLRLSDETALRLFCVSLIGGLVWLLTWLLAAAHWTYHHLCY
jgi:hypothetical protein